MVWVSQSPADCCMPQGLSFAVFGLGNKQYEHFAAVGKRLQKALASLGAAPVCRRGDGDDDDDIDADFEAWQADLLSALDLSPIAPDPKVNTSISHNHDCWWCVCCNSYVLVLNILLR